MRVRARAGQARMFVAMVLLLAACHGPARSASPGQSDAGQADVLHSEAAPRNHCDADAAASVLGAAWEPALLQRVLVYADADVARVLREDSIITKEYRAGRVNVVVDAEDRVTRVYCG